MAADKNISRKTVRAMMRSAKYKARDPFAWRRAKQGVV